MDAFDRALTRPHRRVAFTGKNAAPPRDLIQIDMTYYKDICPQLRPSLQGFVAEELKQVPPLPSMPPCLFPTRLPLPPYIHCGLPITDAQIKQVLRDNHYRSPMRLFDEHGNIVPASPDEPVPAMDATAAAQYISERVGYPVDVRYVLNAPTDAILSFGDNYALYRKAKVLPTNEKLQELLKFLELPEIEKPKWYIACLDYDWSFSRFGYC